MIPIYVWALHLWHVSQVRSEHLPIIIRDPSDLIPALISKKA